MLGLEHPNTMSSFNNLGFFYKRQGNYREAEPLLRRALEIRERVLGPEHPDTATSLNNLAGFYQEQGKHQEAEPLYQPALKIRQCVLGPEHPDTQVTQASYTALLLQYMKPDDQCVEGP